MCRGVSSVLLLAACALTGCGGGDEAGRQPVFKVTGTVMMHGSPLGSAIVSFAPQEGQPTAVGRTNDEGKFQLTTYEYGDGAAAGAFRVVVNKSIAVPASGGSAGKGGDHEAAEAASGAHDAAAANAKGGVVPALYTRAADTPLNAEVKSDGENDFTLEIN
jgi:hypothetical protein